MWGKGEDDVGVGEEGVRLGDVVVRDGGGRVGGREKGWKGVGEGYMVGVGGDMDMEGLVGGMGGEGLERVGVEGEGERVERGRWGREGWGGG